MEAIGKETRRAGSGPALALKNYLERPGPRRLEYLARAVLTARGMDPEAWRGVADAVEAAAADPSWHPLDCECEECA